MNEDKTDLENIDLDENLSDSAMSIVRGVSSVVPGGGFVSEIIGHVIPNQQMARIVKTLKILISIVTDLKGRLDNEESIDLFQDAMIQASRAMTDERRLYIANMLKNGLTKEEQTHIEKKKLFTILNELNDAEIILLKYYSMSLGRNWEHPFLKKHWEVLGPIEKELAGQKTEPRRVVFIENYINTLDRLGLVTMQTNLIQNRRPIGTSTLGRLLLDYIELSEE